MARISMMAVYVWCIAILYGITTIYAQTQCTGEGCLRVVRIGSENGAGRVEVYHNGEWGTICERSEAWSEKNALVACVLVRYPNGARNPTLHGMTPFVDQANSIPIHYSSVSCLGSETRITQCQFSTDVSGCERSDDAGVLCWIDTPSQADIRLVGDRDNGEGLVEFYDRFDGWIPVCPDPSSWTSDVADIACRQLGYSSGVAATYRFGQSFPISTSSLRQTIFGCPSDAFGLDECSSSNSNDGSFCFSADYAGVECTSTDASDGDVRLIGGDSPREGRVEVYYNGRWGAVCETGWDSTDAEVVCEQLGFGDGSANAFPTTTYRGDSNAKPVWLTNIDCDSSDTEISSCDFDQPIGGEPCSSFASIGGAQVDCGSPSSGGLSPGAIAGIVIAVFVVVGGFVGFLVYNDKKKKKQQVQLQQEQQRQQQQQQQQEQRRQQQQQQQQQQQRSSSTADEVHSSQAQAEATPANPDAEFTKQPPPAYHAAPNFPTADEAAAPQPTDLPPPYPGPPSAPYPPAAAYYPPTAPYPAAVHPFAPYPPSTGPAYPPPVPNYQGYPFPTNPAYPPMLDPAYPPSVAPYPDTLQQGAPPPPPPGELPYPSALPPGSENS